MCKKHRSDSINTEYFKSIATEPTLDLPSRLNQNNDDGTVSLTVTVSYPISLNLLFTLIC